ncbi:flavin reductase family protein [Planktomarina temperata]|nr:flavin reductase family protein [Planktomarina temperata]MDA9116110.1 flavin reductase family protein [Planktomarina temperata]
MTETGKTMVDRSLFIEAMRYVAQSVTVVTTQGADGCTGATVSAFSSLSADPPSVLVCLRSDSRIGLAVGRNRVFCVNVLPEGASALAGRFAGRFDDEEPDRFGAIDCRNSHSGPVLSGATAFECTVDQIITHGSHDIFIGNVTAITNAATPPLAYMDGSFQIVRPEGAS